MPTPPDKYLDRAEWSAEDHSRWLRDPTYRAVNPEYRQAERKTLADAGFEVDPEPKTDPNEMSSQDFLDRLRSR
jgi:hypothetical protein